MIWPSEYELIELERWLTQFPCRHRYCTHCWPQPPVYERIRELVGLLRRNKLEDEQRDVDAAEEAAWRQYEAFNVGLENLVELENFIDADQA